MAVVTSEAERRVRDALRVVRRHADNGRCERCTDTECPVLARAQGLTKPGEW